MNDIDLIHLDVVVGSRGHGLSRPDSDEDRRGFYIAPTEDFWKFDSKPKEQLEDKVNDHLYYEIGKFLKLCLSCNPSVIEVLYAKQVRYESRWGEELRDFAYHFMSKKAIKTYGGYAHQQIKLIHNYIKRGGELGDSSMFRWKNAMHCARLFHSGIHLFQTGKVLVDVSEHVCGDNLVQIRDGFWTPQFFFEYIKKLDVQFKKEADRTKLPDEPNYDYANAFLIDVRREYL